MATYQEAMGQGELAAGYLNWLAGQSGLTLEQLEGGMGWWSGVWGTSNDIKDQWERAKSAVASGNLMGAPRFADFAKAYGIYQDIAGTTTGVGGEIVVPDQLVRQSDGTYTDYNGNKVDADTAALMLQSYLSQLQQSGTDLTAFQQAQIEQAIQELAWEKQQFGSLSAYQQATLGQDYNEYLAGLAAQPATWIERWFAEKLPPGTPYQLGAYGTPMTPSWAGTQQQPQQLPPQQLPPQVPPIIGGAGGVGGQLGTPENPLTPYYGAGQTGFVEQAGPPLSAYPVETIYNALRTFSPELGEEWAARRAEEIKYGVEWGVTQPVPAGYVQPTNLPPYVEQYPPQEQFGTPTPGNVWSEVAQTGGYTVTPEGKYVKGVGW